MLKDCMEIFEKRLKKYCEDTDRDEISFITDSYVLADGTYILMDIETGKILKTLEVDKNTDKSSDSYKEFAQKDYLSRLIDMNKAVDSSKQIHSNNYLSFFMKKEAIASKNLKEENFDKYYEILKNPLLKYKSKNGKELYLSYEKENGKPNEELISKCKNSIQNFLFQNSDINQKYWENKSYLKIFFDKPIEDYKIESNRYVLINIYNKNDYNKKDESNQIFGLPNNNMGMNDKKPYLENKSKINTIPYYICGNLALRQKLFFDYLMNLASSKVQHVYITTDDCVNFTKSEDETINKTVILTDTKTIFCNNVLDINNGFYLHILKKTECEIQDFAQVYNIKDSIKYTIEDIVKIASYDKIEPKLKYGKNTSKSTLWEQINTVLYSNWLKSNLFTEAKDIKIKSDSFLKNQILKSRQGWIDWYYKGQDKSIKKNIEKYCDEILKNTVLYGSYFRACEQYNLKFALVNYFNNKELKMSEKIKNIIENLDKKMNSEEESYIENPEEFYFAIGQTVQHLISCNKSSKKTNILYRPFLNAKSVSELKSELSKLFKKYSHDEKTTGKRFKNLYKMVSLYETDTRINFDMMTGGYLSQSLVYKKKEN